MIIEFTKKVEFRDHAGTLIKIIEPGTQMTATADADFYWITPIGGIFKEEARLVSE